MMTALDRSQRAEGDRSRRQRPRNNNLTEAFKDNTVVPYAGVRGDAS